MKSKWSMALAVMLSTQISGAVASAGADAGLCRREITKAAQVTGVPEAVLYAIAQTESGRGARAEPWPWLITTGGRDFAFGSEAEAREFARATLRSGQQNFDLGCFQINYRWHHAHFPSLDEMLRPDRNALYAARFLAEKYERRGSWSLAAGDYHSMTPEHAARYRAKFDQYLAKGSSAPETPAPVKAPTVATNRYPLLRAAAGDRSPGSLVVLGALR